LWFSRLAHTLAEQSQEQSHVTERTERRLREGYEAKLAELTQQRAALEKQVATLEADLPKRRLMRLGDTVHLTQAEIDSLRQMIAEQETLLLGYQVCRSKHNVTGFLVAVALNMAPWLSLYTCITGDAVIVALRFVLLSFPFCQVENEAATTKLKECQREMRDREERLTTEIRRLHAHELNSQQQQPRVRLKPLTLTLTLALTQARVRPCFFTRLISRVRTLSGKCGFCAFTSLGISCVCSVP